MRLLPWTQFCIKGENLVKFASLSVSRLLFTLTPWNFTCFQLYGYCSVSWYFVSRSVTSVSALASLTRRSLCQPCDLHLWKCHLCSMSGEMSSSKWRPFLPHPVKQFLSCHWLFRPFFFLYLPYAHPYIFFIFYSEFRYVTSKATSCIKWDPRKGKVFQSSLYC